MKFWGSEFSLSDRLNTKSETFQGGRVWCSRLQDASCPRAPLLNCRNSSTKGRMSDFSSDTRLLPFLEGSKKREGKGPGDLLFCYVLHTNDAHAPQRRKFLLWIMEKENLVRWIHVRRGWVIRFRHSTVFLESILTNIIGAQCAFLNNINISNNLIKLVNDKSLVCIKYLV